MRIVRWFSRVQNFIDRPWYVPFISFLAGIDLFIVIVPTEPLVISAVLLRPKKWIRIFFFVALGSAIGALALALFINLGPNEVILKWLSGAIESNTWNKTVALVNSHGVLALLLISLGPLPQQPGVVVAALAGLSVEQIFLAVLAGRCLKYGVFAWLASHSPRLLYKLKSVRKGLDEIQDNGRDSSKPL